MSKRVKASERTVEKWERYQACLAVSDKFLGNLCDKLIQVVKKKKIWERVGTLEKDPHEEVLQNIADVMTEALIKSERARRDFWTMAKADLPQTADCGEQLEYHSGTKEIEYREKEISQ